MCIRDRACSAALSVVQALATSGASDQSEWAELALVASACTTDKAALQAAVQPQRCAGLGEQVRQTVIEKRATFACTPGLRRPSAAIAPGLWAAGDYIDGPYPATLEGAVRSGLQAAERCTTTA